VICTLQALLELSVQENEVDGADSGIGPRICYWYKSQREGDY
jgi:hypothetical protein